MNYRELFSLRNRVAIVTGGAGLIGREICLALAQAGAQVYVAEIDEDKAHRMMAGPDFRNLNVNYLGLDIADAESVEKGVGRVIQEKGEIDIFINNAYPRTEDWGAQFENIDAGSLEKNVSMHLNGYILCSQKVLPQMKKQNKGVLINLGSIYGVVGPNFKIYEDTDMTMPAAYSAIKGGIVSFSRYLATYYAKYNIRVNVVCPGGVTDNQDRKFIDAYERLTPLGRMAVPKEIAGPVLFLCSDAASYITGQVLMVDGGWTAW